MINSGKIENTERFLAGLFFSACFLFFYFIYKYHLFFVEQQQIFLLTPEYFLSYLSKPAFLSSYIGDYITQFYYLTGGGAVVITLTFITLWLLVRKLIKRFTGKESGSLLPLIPVILSWIALCDIEFPIAAIVSMVISVAFTLIYISIKKGWLRFTAGIIILPLLYITAGSYFFLFAILSALYEILNGDTQKKYMASSLLIIAFLTPLCLKSHYLITTLQAYTWISDAVRNPRILYFLPSISLTVTVLLYLISFGKARFRLSGMTLVLSRVVVLLVILVPGIWFTADFTLEKILALDYEAIHNRWNRVYELSNRYNLRNNISSYYTNMAMAKAGILGDELMNHYQPAATGLFIPVNANETYLTITFSNEVWWQLGDVNASQHSALLGMIFSPRSRNTRLMKRLVEINIVNGEYAVAEKYINILEKTLFYSKWANEKRRFLNSEAECKGSQWIASKRAIIPTTDLLKSENEYKKTLEMLAEAHPENRMAVDYLLCYDLLDKNIRSFAENFKKYYNQEVKSSLPKVYQEALLIEIASGRYKPEDFGNFVFNPENVRRMAEYTKLYEESNGKGSALQEKFGKSYWFYYHFAVMDQ